MSREVVDQRSCKQWLLFENSLLSHTLRMIIQITSSCIPTRIWECRVGEQVPTWSIREGRHQGFRLGRGCQLVHPSVTALPVIGAAHTGGVMGKQLGSQPGELLVVDLVALHQLLNDRHEYCQVCRADGLGEGTDGIQLQGMKNSVSFSAAAIISCFLAPQQMLPSYNKTGPHRF